MLNRYEIIGKGIPSAPLNVYKSEELEGKVRVADRENRHILQELEEGELLITEMTDAAQEIGLIYAKGVITERGGILCHAAIFCNSVGIPCVLSVDQVTKKLKTGDYVKIDYEGNIYRRINDASS